MLVALALSVGVAGAAEGSLYGIGLPNMKTSGVGVGVTVGNPTGVTAAWHPGGPNAFQAGMGWNWSQGRLDTNVDWLRTLAAPRIGSMHLPVYVGAGVGVTDILPGSRPNLLRRWFGPPTGVGLGVRVPVGASLFFERMPLEVFAQTVPSAWLLPHPEIRADLMLGGRWYF